MIIDAHCHVASDLFIPRAFVEASAANVCAMMLAAGLRPSATQIVERALAELQDHDATDLLSQMDDANIETTVLLVPDFTIALLGCALSVEEALLRHKAIADRHPTRFRVFGGVDPRHGQAGVFLFEKSIDQWQFSGFKVYPPCGFSPSDERLFPYYEICRDRGLPVMVHIGPTSPALAFEFARPELLDAAARAFPGVNFILAHGPLASTEESLAMATYRPNVYLDLSGFPSGPRSLVDRTIRTIVSRGVNHKVLFGTDWPVGQRNGTPKDALRYLLEEDGPLAGLPQRQVDMILGANAKRLLDSKAEHDSCWSTRRGEYIAPLPLCRS